MSARFFDEKTLRISSSRQSWIPDGGAFSVFAPYVEDGEDRFPVAAWRESGELLFLIMTDRDFAEIRASEPRLIGTTLYPDGRRWSYAR